MDIEKLTLSELRELAKEKGIINISKLKKEELLHTIKQNLTKKEGEKKAESKEIDKNVTENNSNSEKSAYTVTNEEDKIVEGILEVLPDGYGFLRGDNYLSTSRRCIYFPSSNTKI